MLEFHVICVYLLEPSFLAFICSRSISDLALLAMPTFQRIAKFLEGV